MKRPWRRYWKTTAVIGVLFTVFFVARTGQITRGPEQVSKRPVPVIIKPATGVDPVLSVRGERCLLTESYAACKLRVP